MNPSPAEIAMMEHAINPTVWRSPSAWDLIVERDGREVVRIDGAGFDAFFARAKEQHDAGHKVAVTYLQHGRTA